jgi:trehalose/maltose transport system substrate-binding protein
MRGWRFASLRLAAAVGVMGAALALWGCSRSSLAPVTLTFIDQEGLQDIGQRYLVSDTVLQEFTRQTGIRVTHLPTPESNLNQLSLYRKLLEEGATTPDVYGIDAIWSGILGEYFIDLRGYFPAELAPQDLTVLASYTDHGKLVAMPYHQNTGVLYYRTDLLRRYGYSKPPATWDEVEKMSVRIQAGERARGDPDFWGYVWPGAAEEGLTCNALEWQVSEGGGHIIEADEKVSVDNPRAIGAWERAAHWVGWISPPSVVSYEEWDAANAFWISGTAAFTRGWSYWFLDYPSNAPWRDRIGVTSVPGGASTRVSTIGGSGLAVSRSSAHRPEAIKLIEFLIRREAQIRTYRARSVQLQQTEVYELPTILMKTYPAMAQSGEAPGATIVLRPSDVAGPHYEEVSQAYRETVHSVLTGSSQAPVAAAQLKQRLAQIMGKEAK